jgi:hypothetical protein
VTQLADLGVAMSVEAAGAALARCCPLILRGREMDERVNANPESRLECAGVKQKGGAKTARIPIKIVPAERLKKPEWIRVRAPSSPRFAEIKRILREHSLHTVCEEASCPNIGECFARARRRS